MPVLFFLFAFETLSEELFDISQWENEIHLARLNICSVLWRETFVHLFLFILSFQTFKCVKLHLVLARMAWKESFHPLHTWHSLGGGNCKVVHSFPELISVCRRKSTDFSCSLARSLRCQSITGGSDETAKGDIYSTCLNFMNLIVHFRLPNVDKKKFNKGKQ